jgi:hypothetical protein
MIKGGKGEQLRMFMTAQELHGLHSIDVQQTPESRFGGAYKTMDAMWRRKRLDNKKDGLNKDVASRGVQYPVELAVGSDVDGTVIQDGHHRIQAAYETNPHQYLPVEWTDLDASKFGKGRR